MDAAIVGGGLAGLGAAIWAAQAGCSVAVFEKAAAVGGRAATRAENGFSLNQGPHALYRRGAAARLLRELGIEPRGGVPPTPASPARAWRSLP